MEPSRIKAINNIHKHNIIQFNQQNKNDNLYNNFNIKLKGIKLKIKYHNDIIYCSTVLKDGRFATGSKDNSINVYNMKTYALDFTIKEHSKAVTCSILLRSGLLASCSCDSTIKLFSINNNNYKVEQILNHKTGVDCIYELNDERLVSGSDDIIFYINKNNEYFKDYQLKTDYPCFHLAQIKENELCYHEYITDLYFYDLIKRRIKNKIKFDDYIAFLKMITNDLLIIGGENKISIINVNRRGLLLRTIKVPDSGLIYCSCMLNKNMLLTGDDKGTLKQWKIEGNNLNLISKKENAHNEVIMTILNLRNGCILSGSGKGVIKIW